MSRNITGSSAGDAVHCAASHALPCIIEPSHEKAVNGIYIHEYIRAYVEGVKLPDIPGQLKGYCDVDKYLHGLNVRGAEGSFLLNVKEKTVRFVGWNINRKYPEHGPYEVALTIDIVGCNDDGIPVELDWKSGRFIEGGVENNWQRRLCAAALLLHYDSTEVISKNVYLRDDNTDFADETVFSIMDIYGFLDEFKGVIDKVLAARRIVAEGGIPDVTIGDHCQYCPAFNHCPAKTAMVKEFVGGDLTNLKERVLSMTPAQQGFAMTKVKEFMKVGEEVENVLKEAAKRQPLPTPDGKEYRFSTKSRDYFDADAARGLILTLLLKNGLTEEQAHAKIQTLYGKTVYKELRKMKVIK